MVMLSGMAAAQSFPTFIADGKTWECERDDGKAYSYTIEGDTVIGVAAYSKLYLIRQGEHKYFAALREDGRKVYMLCAGEEREVLLYDFGLKPQDKLKINGWDISIYSDWLTYCTSSRSYHILPITISDGYLGPTCLFYWVDGVGITGDPFDTTHWPYHEILRSCFVGNDVYYDCNELWRLIGIGDVEPYNYEYTPLVRKDVQWMYYHDNSITGEAWDYGVNFAGPVEIDDRNYYVVYNHVIDPNLTGAYPAGYMREEGHQVYWLENPANDVVDSNDEELLFDFNDMSNIYPEKEFTRGYVVVDGMLRGAFFEYGEPAFIEGIGSVNSGVLPSFMLPPDGSREGLSYVTENGRIVFKGPRYDDHLFYQQHGLSKFKCDLNGDNEVNVADISALYREIINQENPGIGIFDTNGDGVVNVADVSALYKVILQ